MMYDGKVYTFFDDHDRDKSLVVGENLDSEGDLYIAFHIDGKPVLRNAVYGKRWGNGIKDESAGKPDKRTIIYINKTSALELYDLLGRIFEGHSHGGNAADNSLNMESPEYNEGMSINDLLLNVDPRWGGKQ